MVDPESHCFRRLTTVRHTFRSGLVVGQLAKASVKDVMFGSLARAWFRGQEYSAIKGPRLRIARNFLSSDLICVRAAQHARFYSETSRLDVFA